MVLTLPVPSMKILFLFTALCYFFMQILIYNICPIPSISGHVPILMWWTPFMNQMERTVVCKGIYKCVINSERSIKMSPHLGALMFYGSHMDNCDYPLPRNYSIPWALFHEESPKNYAPLLFPQIQKIFNLTSTFSRKSHFPLTLQYLESLDLITDTKYYKPVDVKNILLEKLSPVLYIQSNCDTPSDRDYIVNELSKYIQIDSYGKCLRNKKLPTEFEEVPNLDLYNEKYMDFISQYKFVIAIENAVCVDYITEKLWRPLIVGSIPIYYGSNSVRDLLPNNNSAILLDDFDSIASLANFIRIVNENDTLYNEFLKHKIDKTLNNRNLESYLLDNHPVSAFECFVCEKVHQSKFMTVQENIYDCPIPKQFNKNNTWNQHWLIGQCQAKHLANLLSIGKPFSAEEFEKFWLAQLQKGRC